MADATQRAAMQAERKALETYLKECDDFAIVPDVGGAWAAAWRAARAENTTPTLREAAQQALEALEAAERLSRQGLLNAHPALFEHVQTSRAASITALRAALAEQAAEQAVIPPAFAHAASQQMAVTSEWCRGWDACRAHILSAAPAAEQAEPVAWREHVEQRLHQWRASTINEDGDRVSLSDYLSADALDDLIDYVCDEWFGPAAPPAPARQEWQPVADHIADASKKVEAAPAEGGA